MMGLAFLKKSKWHQVDREGENLLWSGSVPCKLMWVNSLYSYPYLN
jgi:hypothetical protein